MESAGGRSLAGGEFDHLHHHAICSKSSNSLRPLLGVEPSGMGDAAGQMRAEVGDPIAVLLVRAESDAVAQRRLEPVVIVPRHVGHLIDDDARGALADTLSHDARLVVMDGETLLDRGRRDVDREPADRPRERVAAGEDQVVGVSGVMGFRRTGQSGEPGIESEHGEVGQRRRGRGALRQVRTTIQPAGSPARDGASPIVMKIAACFQTSRGIVLVLRPVNSRATGSG